MSDITERPLVSAMAGVNAIASTIVNIMVEKGVISADEASLRFQTLAGNLSAQLTNPLGAQMALQIAQTVETVRRDRPQATC